MSQRSRVDIRRRFALMWLWPVATLATINALSMMRDAQHVGHDTRVLAQTLCAHYPQISENVFADLMYAGAQAAHERLRTLHQLRFAPFDECNVDNVSAP